MSKTYGFCCFCGSKFEGFGNNPSPASNKATDRCCNKCNWVIVMPARLASLEKKNKGGK